MKTSVPPELFGDAVMILEFLNTFGPLFDIKEVIRGGITFGNTHAKINMIVYRFECKLSFFRSH